MARKNRFWLLFLLTVAICLTTGGVAAAQTYSVQDRSGATIWAGRDWGEALQRLDENFTLVFGPGTHQINLLNVDYRGVTLEGRGRATIECEDINLNAPSCRVQGLTIKGKIVVQNYGATISNNVLSSSSIGIEVKGDARNLMVRNNDISGCNIAIYLNPSWEIRDVTITGNTIGGSGSKVNNYGVVLESGTYRNINIQNNDFLGNTIYALENRSDYRVNATRNWWGNAKGPHLASYTKEGYQNVVGEAAVSPWLNRPAAQQGTAVYEVYNETRKRYYATLQEAVDYAYDGDVIRLGAYEFAEEIVFDRDLVIIGAGQGKTVLNALGTPYYPSEFVLKVNPGCRVSLTGLTVEGLEAASYGVLVAGGEGLETVLHLQDVNIRSPIYYGVRADGELSRGTVEVHITGCRIETGFEDLAGNLPAGIFLNGRQVRGYITNTSIVKQRTDALGLLKQGASLGEAVNRLSGADRYATAVEICKAGWSTADTVVIATGADFADALVAAPFAAMKNAPLLLTEKNRLPAAVETEIRRLGAYKAYIVGNPQAVSEEVENRLTYLGLSVIRICGEDRYGTSAAIAREMAGSAYIDGVIIAVGSDFPDTLAAGPLAAYHRRPILLVQKDRVPYAVMDFLRSLSWYELWIVGGTGAVSDRVVTDIQNETRVSSHLRLSGSTRYETALAIANKLRSDYGVYRLKTVLVARGDHFADALAGGVLAARSDFQSAVVLTESGKLHASTRKWLADYCSGEAYLLGGTGAISTAVENEIKGIF